MKVWHKESGKEVIRDAVDARELIATGEYTDVNPNPDEPQGETAAEVMTRTQRLQAEDSARAHAEQQHGSGQAMRDARETNANLAHVNARKLADEARASANEAHQLAAANATDPRLKANADQAEKRAVDLEEAANDAADQAAEADARARKQREEEEAASAAASGNAKPDNMTVLELKKFLDFKGVEYTSDDRRDDLVKLAKKASK